MNSLSEIINSIAELKFEVSNFEDDLIDDLDPYYFLSKSEVSLIKSYSKIPLKKWTNAMECKSFEILLKYKEELLELDIDIDNLNKPDFDSYKLEGQPQKIYMEENKIFLCNKLCKKYDICKINKNADYTTIKLSPNIIYKLIIARNNKDLILSENITSFINVFLNNIDYDKGENDLNLKNINGYNRELMDFQQIGCLFGLLNKKILLADEMGLGKSVESLSILRLTDTFKTVIVCPKSLKYKWEKECSFLEDVSVEIISEKTDLKNLSKDIYITNYDNINNVAEYFESNSQVKSIIFDECHYLKNPKSKRSKICLKIAKNKEYVLLLSGSPMLNRPSELVNQLDTLGVLENFGGYTDFKEKYDTPDGKNIEKLYLELSKKLRSSIYIRREKKQILKNLPDKQRTTITVDIDLKEYKKELLRYKDEKNLKVKKNILENLKQIAAHGKYDYIKERINSSIENNEKLIVFAYHKSMQARLINDFPNALCIISSQSDIERNKNAEQFQNDPNKHIIICSIGSAYYGFDLFASSQVLFAEMDWVPEINVQAEDRAHRIGQECAVNIWYVIAKNTLEERILQANIDKSKITKKVNKNVSIEQLNNKSRKLKDELIKYLDELNI